jgi:hypothetical protein
VLPTSLRDVCDMDPILIWRGGQPEGRRGLCAPRSALRADGRTLGDVLLQLSGVRPLNACDRRARVGPRC